MYPHDSLALRFRAGRPAITALDLAVFGLGSNRTVVAAAVVVSMFGATAQAQAKVEAPTVDTELAVQSTSEFVPPPPPPPATASPSSLPPPPDPEATPAADSDDSPATESSAPPRAYGGTAGGYGAQSAGGATVPLAPNVDAQWGARTGFFVDVNSTTADEEREDASSSKLSHDAPMMDVRKLHYGSIGFGGHHLLLHPVNKDVNLVELRHQTGGITVQGDGLWHRSGSWIGGFMSINMLFAYGSKGTDETLGTVVVSGFESFTFRGHGEGGALVFPFDWLAAGPLLGYRFQFTHINAEPGGSGESTADAIRPNHGPVLGAMARITSRPSDMGPALVSFDQKIRHHVGIGTAATTYYDMDLRFNLGKARGLFISLFAEFRLNSNADFTPEPSAFFTGGVPSDAERIGELSDVFAHSSPVARRLGAMIGFNF